MLRSTMSNAADLHSRTAVYAVMGAKLRKVQKGLACAAREPVLFNVHKGGPLREHLEKLLKTSLGVFALNRCKEIRKQPIVYAAILPDDTDLGDLSSILALIYGVVPFAPRHSAVPKPYQGEPFKVINQGRPIGLPPEIGFGVETNQMLDPDKTRDSDANLAMAAAIAQEAATTRGSKFHDVDATHIATDRVARPEIISTEKVDKPPSLIETSKVDKSGAPGNLKTERVPRPQLQLKKTEFVPHPGPDDDEKDDDSAILDEASNEST